LAWLGPRFSIAELSGRYLALLPVATNGGPGIGLAFSPEQIEAARSALQVYNLSALLTYDTYSTLALLLLVDPGMRVGVVPAALSGLGGRVELRAASQVILVGLLLLLAGAGLAASWLGAIAQQVRDGRGSLSRLLRSAPGYWLAIVGFWALLIGVALGISLPLGALTRVMLSVAPPLAMFVAIFTVVSLQLLTIWALLFLYFFADAIVVSEVGPIRAAANSVRVVSSNFWSTLGFIIITWLIMRGLHEIWQNLAQVPVGSILAIFGNGYVESGLAAASMLFYRNRIAR
jgi:hypothetical protein